MAGPILGEMPIEIGGRRYRFVLGTYGLRQLEQTLRKPWPTVFTEANNPDALHTTTVLAIFHAGLVFHHEGLTERQASLLLDELGLDKFGEYFRQAVQAALPEPSANPPQPAAVTNGSGTASSPIG